MQMTSITEFLLELDKLKQVERKNYISTASRRENSAEHSWHLAMACWCFNQQFNLQLSDEKLLKLALVHDLGEIDAGDTFLYAAARSDAHIQERQCIERLQAFAGGISELTAGWDDQEFGQSPEAKLLKAVDRLLPFMLNIATKGKTWREMGVKRHQVEQAHAFIQYEFPQIHQWITQQLELGSIEGWLNN